MSCLKSFIYLVKEVVVLRKNSFAKALNLLLLKICNFNFPNQAQMCKATGENHMQNFLNR